MPSNFNTALDGLNVINASATSNKTSTIAKAAGTATTNITRVSTQRPTEFDGSSSDGLSTALIASTGPVGLAIGYASGTTLGAVDTIRRGAELGISNLNQNNSDPVHDKRYDRFQIFEASGYSRLRDGRIVNATGAVISTPLPSATGDYGADQANFPSSGSTQYSARYFFKQGNVNAEINLPARSQK